MSLKDQFNNGQETRSATGEKAYAGEAPRRGRGNLFDDGPLVKAGIAGNELAKFSEHFAAYSEANKAALTRGGQLSWAVVPAPSTETKMKLDAAIVIGKAVTSQGEVTCALTVIFTGGVDLPKQSVEVDNRREVTYSAVANDQYTESYQSTLLNLIANKAPDLYSESMTLMGAITIVNGNLSEAKNNEIVVATVNSVYGYIGNILRNDHFSLVNMDREKTEFTSRVTYNQGDAYEPITELPRRRDLSVQVDLSSKQRTNRNSNSLENVEGSVKVATIDGFVDLLYMGRPEGSNSRRNRFSNRREDETEHQIYGRNLNITNMEHASSPEHMLLAMAQLPVLISENVLITALKPAGDNAKLRTPIALTYELPEKFEDVPEVLDDNEWGQLTEVVMQDDAIFVTLIIDETGITTTQQKLLLMATDTSNPDYKAYADLVVQAGDNLTDNRFSEALEKDGIRPTEIGTKMDYVVLLGTWVDDRGQIRSLTEIDYYAILTAFGQKDPKIVQDWERCMTDDKCPLDMRLAKMEEIIDQFTGGSYTITGHGTPVQLNTEWLFTLTNSAEAAGMVTAADGIYQDTRYRRGFQRDGYKTSGYDGKAFRARNSGKSYW